MGRKIVARIERKQVCLEASLVQKSDPLTEVKCRATSEAAKLHFTGTEGVVFDIFINY